MPKNKNLTLSGAAKEAGMTIEGIRDAIRRGKLKATVIATRPVYRISRAALAAYLRQADKEPRGRPRSRTLKEKGS
jgi:hypothetical protein